MKIETIKTITFEKKDFDIVKKAREIVKGLMEKTEINCEKRCNIYDGGRCSDCEYNILCDYNMDEIADCLNTVTDIIKEEIRKDDV